MNGLEVIISSSAPAIGAKVLVHLGDSKREPKEGLEVSQWKEAEGEPRTWALGPGPWGCAIQSS